MNLTSSSWPRSQQIRKVAMPGFVCCFQEGQGLVLSHLNSQHVAVSGAWAEIRTGSGGGMQASQTLAQRPLPALH